MREEEKKSSQLLTKKILSKIKPFSVGLFFSLLIYIIDYNFPECRGFFLFKSVIVIYFVFGFLVEFIFPKNVLFIIIGVYIGQILFFTGGDHKGPLSVLILVFGIIFCLSVFFGALAAFPIRKFIFYMKMMISRKDEQQKK